MANTPKIQKALYPQFPKIDPSIGYPFKRDSNPNDKYVLSERAL